MGELFANSYVTSCIDSAVRLHRESTDPFSPITVCAFFTQHCQKYARRRALAFCSSESVVSSVDGIQESAWQYWTYSQYLEDVRNTAKAFIALGLRPFHSVCILSYNSPFWFISALAAIFAGGVNSSIYPTSKSDSIDSIISHSHAEIIVIEEERHLKDLLQKIEKPNSDQNKLANLKAIITTFDLSEPVSLVGASLIRVCCWKDLNAFSKEVSDEELNAIIDSQAPNKCSTLIYTSGTVGASKGVMLSHDNICFATYQCAKFALEPLLNSKDSDKHQCRIVSYLPLSHIVGQLLDIYVSFHLGFLVFFAQPDALRGSLVKTLKSVQPTFFGAVPRVLEKMSEKLRERQKVEKGLKKFLLSWSMSICKKHVTSSMQSTNNTTSSLFLFPLANMLINSKVKYALGLNHVRMICCGAAPLSLDVINHLSSFNIVPHEAYGLSETTGPITFNLPFGGQFFLGTVGRPYSGNDVKISHEHSESKKGGEIMIRGRSVFMGYLDDSVKNEASFDEEGYFKTGDIGVFKSKDGVKDRYLCIEGRLKEIIITAGGENVAPLPIEEDIKSLLKEIVSNVLLVGDSKKFISVLLTLRSLVDTSSLDPLDELTLEAKSCLTNLASQQNGACQVPSKVSEIIANIPAFLQNHIQSMIDESNTRVPSRAAMVRKWCILPIDFSINGGELGPTLKPKRYFIYEKYAREINQMYESAA